MTEELLAAFGRDTMRRAGGSFTTGILAQVGLDRFAVAASALGDVYVGWSAQGIAGVRIAPDDAAFEAWYGERLGRRAVRAIEDDPLIAAARAALRGEEADVPLDLRACSAFEAAVLRRAAAIPRGDARPYGWLAREMRAPGAMRAVGTALGRNPVPLLVPCHRVIRADNTLGDYVFGREAKRRLLITEGMDLDAVDRVARRGFRYVGCVDGYFCMPTCGHVAGKIDAPGFVGFHSAAEARERGFVPCETCRPAAA